MLITQKKMKMKRIILSLVVIFVMSSFTNANNGSEKINLETIAFEEANYGSNNLFLDEIATTESLPNICIEFAAIVFKGSQADGHSFHKSLTLAYDALNICDTLVAVGMVVNAYYK